LASFAFFFFKWNTTCSIFDGCHYRNKKNTETASDLTFALHESFQNFHIILNDETSTQQVLLPF